MIMPVRIQCLTLLLICILTVFGCSRFNPRPVDNVPFKERVLTQYEGNIRISAAVPSARESKKLFDVRLYRDGIQPIWMEIENNDEEPVWILPVGIDPQYYSPTVVSLLNHFRYSKRANRSMDRYFYERGTVIRIDPKSVRSGFIFTTLDEGTKNFTVDLLGEDHEVRTFTFFINVPGLRVDHHNVKFEDLYSEDEVVSYDEKGFREALEQLPCCTTNKKETNYGDPLNLVVVGNTEDVFHAFIRSGWDETETVYSMSTWKMALSFLFGGEYRYSPVSSLYVYGRSQDIALQKIRESINQRNHLRLWLAPMRYEGKPVWIGQISRDIGVRWTLQGGVILTHKVDPDVDEARDYLIQDLWYSQGLLKLGFVKGAGAAPISEPRQNLTGDPYFSNGHRAVLWVSSEPIEFDEIEFAGWETPPTR